MHIFQLNEESILKAVDTPEDGMGYQIAGIKIQFTGQPPSSGILLNRQFFLTLDDAPKLNDQDDSPLHRDLSEGLLLQPPAEFEQLTAPLGYPQRHILLEASATRGARLAKAATTGTLPPHVGTTIADEVFYRFSAFTTDRSVRADGSLVPKTYATTTMDKTVVPSGLAAVGRYALPTRISARQVFEIRPLPGTPILYGTVTPNFGLAGGGVEVFFLHGTTPGTVKLIAPLPEK